MKDKKWWRVAKYVHIARFMDINNIKHAGDFHMHRDYERMHVHLIDTSRAAPGNTNMPFRAVFSEEDLHEG